MRVSKLEGNYRVSDVSGQPYDGCGGEIIFALWRDDTFQERLDDTGWVPWQAHWLIGGSIAAVEQHEEEINFKYKGRPRLA